MRIERDDISPETYQAIAEIILEKLKPALSGNGKGLSDDELMTIEDAAKLLRISKSQIYQWVNNAQHGLGSFPYLKAGKLLRFSKTAIMKWLDVR